MHDKAEETRPRFEFGDQSTDGGKRCGRPTNDGNNKNIRPSRALRKGEPGWQEVYNDAFKHWTRFRFEEPEIAEAVYSEIVRTVNERGVCNGSEAVTYLKHLNGWHFDSDARTCLVLIAVHRHPEHLWGTVRRDLDGRFCSEGMPWAGYELGWSHG